MPNYYLFRCTGRTYNECLEKRLFGASVAMHGFVSNVQVGDILYLNYLPSFNDRNIFIEGPFIAQTTIGNYDSNAWGGRFPSQIKVDTSLKRKKTNYPDYVSLFGEPNQGNYSYDFILMDRIKGEKLTKALGTDMNNESDIFGFRNFRQKWPLQFRAEDGHFVRSLSETLIDNWLYNNDYIHCYEKKLPIKENVLCDFYLKDKNLYIEFWGMKEELYLKRKQEKIEIYEKNNLNLINLEINDIKDLDSTLPKKINGILDNYNLI
jgi:hypothetical protein